MRRLAGLGLAPLLLIQAALAQTPPPPAGSAPRPDALAQPQRENLCLTCPRPVPACWMTLYRWQDFNLKGGFGTTVVVTTGNPPTEADKDKARLQILSTMAPKSRVFMDKSSRIACPEGTQVE